MVLSRVMFQIGQILVDSVLKVSSENDSNEKNDWISVTVD